MAACQKTIIQTRTFNYHLYTNKNIYILVTLLAVICHCLYGVNAVEEYYSLKHISPKSEHPKENYADDSIKSSEITIKPLDIVLSSTKLEYDHEPQLETSEKTIEQTQLYQNQISDKNTEHSQHVIVIRSASPIISGDKPLDEFHFTTKNINENFETNDVDIRNGIYRHLSPTRSHIVNKNKIIISSNSGEAMRAPRGKALPLSEPRFSTRRNAREMTTERDIATEIPRGRQANPDIQDIITGIVKLLNGKVNVQANTAPSASRPHRPVSTRINNRGPPRISDVPPLPSDFDVNPPDPAIPSSSVLPPPPTNQKTPPLTTQNSPPPTKIPPPYPFDLPHSNTPSHSSPSNTPQHPVRPFLNGVPVPEQIVPLGAHRPAINGRPRPPWRRRPRPPIRHPPNIPSYKPLPPIDIDLDLGDEISLTSIEPLNQENMMSHHVPITENHEAVINSNVGQTEATYHDLGDQLTFHDFNSDTNESDINVEITSSSPVENFNKDDFIKEPIVEKKPTNKEKEKPYTTKTDKIIPSSIETYPDLTTERDDEEKDIELNVTNHLIIPITTERILNTSDATSDILPNPTVTSTEIGISTIEITTNSVVTEKINEEIPSEMEIEGIGEAIPVLETSIKDIESIMSTVNTTSAGGSDIHSQSTPTEGLPSFTSTETTTTTKSSLDSKTTEITSTTSEVNIINNQPSVSSTQNVNGFSYFPYRPRPGIVLDDTDYKPGVHRRPPVITRPVQVNGGAAQTGDIFDVTVSAIQGPGASAHSNQGKPFVIPVDIDGVHISQTNADVITSSSGTEGFVSIDGKRTYLNLFGDATEEISSTSRTNPNIKPTKTVTDNIVQVTGTGYAIPQENIQLGITNRPTGSVKPSIPRRPLFGKRPQPTVRIDTCIVGDDSTCDAGQQEMCRTDMGVSSCHCRPGYSRRKHREPCRRVVAILMSLRVDKMYERRIVWDSKLFNKDSDEYRQLAYEASRAIDSAMSMTPFSDDFLEAKVNNIYKGDPAAGTAGVFVNMTIHLEEHSETVRPQVKGDIQRHLLGAIQRRSNNIGNSALWVDIPAGSVSGLRDLDECSSADLNDCHIDAICTNIFGGFTCQCRPGFRDPWEDNRARAGRKCESCPPSYCNNRGQCKYEKNQQTCVCQGNFYGAQCEIDGEVVTVAVSASIAAIIIIGLTLVCLVMWSRKWNREQKAAAAAAGGLGGLGSPVFGYMAAGAGGTVKTPVVGPPPYQLTLEDRMRWAHLADVMAQANHYAPEPVTAGGITRPSSALFGGYPTLSMHSTLAPPVPLPRLGLQMAAQQRAASVHGMNTRNNTNQQASLDNSSSSEEEDRTDLLGRNFQVPRPKSRSSVANQSGIYYDVDYDQGEIYKHTTGGGIPMSTYTPGRPPYFRN